MQRLAEQDVADLDEDAQEISTAVSDRRAALLAAGGAAHQQPSRNSTALIVSSAQEGNYPPVLRLNQQVRPLMSHVRRKDDTSYIICTEVQVVAAKAQVAGAGSRLSLLMPTSVNTQGGELGRKDCCRRQIFTLLSKTNLWLNP